MTLIKQNSETVSSPASKASKRGSKFNWKKKSTYHPRWYQRIFLSVCDKLWPQLSQDWQNRDGLLYGLKGTQSNTLCSVFLPKPSHGGFGQFFPTGTHTGIGTSVSSLKHIMESTTKKKIVNKQRQQVLRFQAKYCGGKTH